VKQSGELKVAIVCDWLTGIGGAERVVLALHQLFPDAPIYTSQYDPQKIDWFKDADVRTTWLQKLPSSLKKFLPVLRAWSFSRLKLRGYDLVISSSGAEAKAVHVPSGTIHINYCHSPTHYYWFRYDEYMKQPGFGPFNWVARLGLGLLVRPMRLWDRRAARRPDVMIANSSFTQANIKKYYGRDSVIIHPPVAIERFMPKTNMTRDHFVTAGRQTPYKRIDLAIAAFTALQLPLTVIGNGPDHERLVKLAGPTISFETNVSDVAMPKQFQAARAFIFPGTDDFGIVAVEALAAGTPVIAFQAGGALDYIIPGKTGEFFAEPTVGALTEALTDSMVQDFDAGIIKETAQQYSISVFNERVQNTINQSLRENSHE